MESTQNNSFFAESLKLVKQFKVPAFDASAVLESRRKDFEALAAANTTALSGLQALGQKQTEIVSAAITRLQSLVAQHNGATVKPAPAAAAGEATQQASKAWQKALADVRELAETAYRVHADGYAVITRRVAENVEELKALLQPAR
ncbi:phasin family protein [Paraburkholderia sp. HP33-1]|uniref:phasin family protein n=1 Tax=Paraburkholderia sp. HP33-1 TaxID=2883243 RepID=UPI001F408C3A|nr:phasin family protein [Paraburkholderia sp. HP33-1]